MILLAENNADSQLTLVVAALFILAGVIAVATVIYWRLTRPEKIEKDSGAAKS